ncbi:MAG TPA: transcription antitermination factor NusB, partial [Xanthobacteraceae bacterium]|nr:transcription antitermination factor NusB [Xanthobacteraceae bacterium]
DRALMRMLVATSLRRLGSLRALLTQYLEQGLPPNVPLVEAALLVGATQLLFLSVPAHAAVDLSVQLVAETRVARRYSGLINAVLRRLAASGRDKLAATPVTVDTPAWLLNRWEKIYGAETARAIAAAHQIEPALDLSVKESAEQWAKRLGGRVLPTGSLRLIADGPVTALSGYDEGAWWVQDAAAALPARLLGEVKGMKVADLCAAPGGKTAQLAAAGANVVAVDRSPSRLKRVAANLTRLGLSAQAVVADAGEWDAGPFDAVLLDAPCSGTGTIRRHPDIPWVKRPEDIATLAALQARLLRRAAALVRPGGLLIYATCSLEPEEGIDQIEAFLAERLDFARVPVKPAEIGGETSLISIKEDLRTLPCHMPDSDKRMGGCDGFYAARLARR